MSKTGNNQVSFGNLPKDVKADDLAKFLERTVGSVLRCKVKKVAENVPPHAFVHFESTQAADEAVKQAKNGDLLFGRDGSIDQVVQEKKQEVWRLKARKDDRAYVDGRRGFNSKRFPHAQVSNVCVELGTVSGPTSMMVSWGPSKAAMVRLEYPTKRLRLYFKRFLQLNRNDPTKTKCDVMLEIYLSEVKRVTELSTDLDPTLLIQLSSPPWIFYRTAEDDIYQWYQDNSQLAEDEDPWIRCLDIVTDGIIGRCFDYKLSVSPRQMTAWRNIIKYYRSHNVLSESSPAEFSFSKGDFLLKKVAQFYSVPPQKGIPFHIMYLVNCLVLRGFIPPTNLSEAFYDLLRSSAGADRVASLALIRMHLRHGSVFDPASLLRRNIEWAKEAMKAEKKFTVVKNNILVRRLIVTPTRAVCVHPESEVSNRVLRHFRRYEDRFLRVSFMDENTLRSMSPESMSVQVAPLARELGGHRLFTRTDVYDRIVDIMKNGFVFCGREYHFLAFSSSQLREGSAWFFASDGHTTVCDIRKWMGKFPPHNVAKHAARMGQCFSATVSTMQVLTSEVLPLPDIERKGYIFSDGCGKISPELAREVANMLDLNDNPPSVYQIRYAGYKGVVGVWPIEAEADSPYKLGLRKSMDKFTSNHRQLEILTWSKFTPCFLNRQIIILLSSLKVPDGVFESLQGNMISRLDRMVVKSRVAENVLKDTWCDLYTIPIQMLRAGFEPTEEAHLRAMLLAIRAGQIEDLLTKSRIFVPHGRILIGCLDETALLDYGQCFVKLKSSAQEDTVITGTVIVTKNPCLHPGDIRVLQAVDIPALHHMVDCLVFPQNGPRPHPNEASGSDLDGDSYFVSWDQKLVPPSRTSWDPMEFDTQVAREMRGNVRMEHVIEFFAKHMINYHLGKICNAHVVHADKSPQGAMDPSCIQLASLAAKAVDYPKTGEPALMPHELKPKEFPDFMEKEDKPAYKSAKVIGSLYRSVKRILSTENVHDISHQKFTPRYDPDLEVDGFEDYVENARATKQVYDLQLFAIMRQFDVADEAEIVVGHVRLNGNSNARKQKDVKERVRDAFAHLRQQFMGFFSPFKLEAEDQNGKSFSVIREQILKAQASACYHITYHPYWYGIACEGLKDDAKRFPLLSFPWLAVDQLAAIKVEKLRLRASGRARSF